MGLRAVTPEEKLLRLIESGEQPGKKSGFGDVRGWAPFLVPYQQRARRFLRSRFVRKFVPQELNLQVVNRGLIVLLALVLAAIGLNTQRVQPNPLDLARPARVASPSATEAPPAAALRPVEDSLGEVDQRDLFNPVVARVAPPEPLKPPDTNVAVAPPKPPEPPPKPAEPTALDVLREKAKTLKLVGIMWGPVPIVMIEDTVKNETSFLKEQDTIDQIRIKAILRDRAVLTYGNADYDLF
jgi:hypothetical protein